MLGRVIQNNPFILKDVDNLFYNQTNDTNLNERIIFEYFDYIKPKIGYDSIFRLVKSHFTNFFGVPNSKQFKSKINEYKEWK